MTRCGPPLPLTAIPWIVEAALVRISSAATTAFMPVTASIRPSESPAQQLSPRLSDAIVVARVLCIVGLVYAHAWTGQGGSELAALSSTPQGVLRWALMEAFGRSAVPLLGMISGWLVAGSTRVRDYPTFIAHKARSILLPMVLWNALATVLVSGAAWLGLLKAPVPHRLGWLLDEIFCVVSPNDINVQTAFLRDLFLCMLAVPWLLRLRRRGLLLVLALVLAWVVSQWKFPLLLRPQILLFFLFGILARREHLAERTSALPLTWAVVPFVMLMPVKIWLSVRGIGATTHWFPIIDVLTRVATAAVYWRLAGHLARTPTLFRRVEPYVFLMFCSHVIMMWLAGPMLARLVGPLGAPGYPALLICMPLIALAASIALGRLLARFTPAAAKILSGGRLKAALRYQPAPQSHQGHPHRPAHTPLDACDTQPVHHIHTAHQIRR